MALSPYSVLGGLNIESSDGLIETQILNGSVDPSSSGVAASTGSLYLRSNGDLYKKFDVLDTDWELITADVSADISALSAAIDNNTANITTLSGDVITISGDLIDVTNDLDSLSGQFVNHTHVKADITDFVESDYVHTTGNETIGGNKTFTNDVVVNGDLTVNGTTTTVSSTDLNVSDNTITLNYGETGAGVSLGTAGFEIDRGTETNTALRWNETTDTWQVTEDGTNYFDILHDGNISNNTDISTLSAAIDNNTTNISTISGLIGDPLQVGNYIDGSTIALDLVELDNAIFTVSGDLDTLESIVGGPLSGGTYITGNTVAEDLYALDVAISNATPPSGSAPGVTTTTVLDSIPLADANLIKWHVYAVLDSDSSRNRGDEIHAVHNGTVVDYNQSSTVKNGNAIVGHMLTVAINGANLELRCEATSATTFRFRRLMVL